MNIVNFTNDYVEEAEKLAISNYLEEQKQTPILPKMDKVPDLTDFAQNGLGVVALEQGRMIGFLGCYEPWEHAFDSNARGTFSPIHAHGAVIKNREIIYQHMYQKAAKLWIDRQITYHAIAMYAHDQAAIHAFFTYGFGLRCVDAIRLLKGEIDYEETNIQFQELLTDGEKQIRPLRLKLIEHLGESPCFMYSTEKEVQACLNRHEQSNNRLFVAKDSDKIVAFVELKGIGENFITEKESMQNIGGAFCLPEYRGKNIYQGLLQYVSRQLLKENYEYLGVDYESINPTANRFWPKNFTPYTNSLTRRIDECILNKEELK